MWVDEHACGGRLRALNRTEHAPPGVLNGGGVEVWQLSTIVVWHAGKKGALIVGGQEGE